MMKDTTAADIEAQAYIEALSDFDRAELHADATRLLDEEEEEPPAEHFGRAAQRHRDNQLVEMADLYADCE